MQTLDPPPTATAETPTDRAITEAVELFLKTKKGVDAHLLTVETQRGIVRLAGQVESLLARDRAEDIALAVRGVRGVLNELTVHAPDVLDEVLQRDVAQALANNLAARNYNLRCTAHHGAITLAGMVQKWSEKQLALRLVRGVRGVRSIADERLALCWGERPRSDADITDHIQAVLDWDIRVQPQLVQVRTSDRVVYLTGAVGSAAEKARVVNIAYQAGATHVDDRLQITDWATDCRLTTSELVWRTDEEMAQAVRDMLARDPRTHAYSLLVHVRDGVATLAGIVGNLGAQQAAEEDARHVVGIWNVYNLLKIRPERMWTDSEIRQAVAEALARDPYVGNDELTVNVLDGKAFLYGRVASCFEQEHARALTADIKGVVAVELHLTVRPPRATRRPPGGGPAPRRASRPTHRPRAGRAHSHALLLDH